MRGREDVNPSAPSASPNIVLAVQDAIGVGQLVTVIRALAPLEASGPTVTMVSPGSVREVMVRS